MLALETVNREFFEETGHLGPFGDSDYSFSVVEQNKVNHIFCKVTHDVNEFEQILLDFYQNKSRNAYVDEIFGTISFPLWIEGPADPTQVSLWGKHAVMGLPRFLRYFALRESQMVLVMLVRGGVLTLDLLKRVLQLSKGLESAEYSNISFLKRSLQWLNNKVNPSFDYVLDYSTFMMSPGLKDLLSLN